MLLVLSSVTNTAPSDARTATPFGEPESWTVCGALTEPPPEVHAAVTNAKIAIHAGRRLMKALPLAGNDSCE